MRNALFTMVFVSAVALTAAVVLSISYAEVPNPEDIGAVAIYRATVNTRDDWPDDLVNYNVTDPDTIQALFSGIEADTLRDCSLLETKNSAYIYVRFSDLTRKVYHLFFRWTHFSLAGDRENCYYVDPSSQAAFERHAQE